MSLEQAVVQLEQTNAALQEEVVRFRDAAMGLNAVYSTITEGRQNTADGKYFSVPGGGAYMRLYRRTGSSAELIAEFPDRDELNSVIDQLGPLLGRGVTGSGDLMAVGFSGLGVQIGSSVSLPWEEAPVGGFYSVGSTDIAGPVGDGFPSQSTGSTMYGAAWSGGNWSKILVDGRGDNSRPPEVYVKAANLGRIKKAVRLCHSDNILGTVSQSDGVPTGAIIESGSNSNGEWLKLADGTYRVMFGAGGSAVGADISSIQTVRSIPVEYSSFVGTPRLTISARFRNYEDVGLPVEARCVSLHGELVPDTSECRFVADFNPSVSRTRNEAYSLTIILEGRWY
ncbi:hypothetical protein [Halomonas sp. H2]|uniref:hypothetical protein n=1 Tax=Halomonas sp. H2 TaxID=261936 RepID=UPI003CF3B63F